MLYHTYISIHDGIAYISIHIYAMPSFFVCYAVILSVTQVILSDVCDMTQLILSNVCDMTQSCV